MTDEDVIQFLDRLGGLKGERNKWIVRILRIFACPDQPEKVPPSSDKEIKGSDRGLSQTPIR